MRYRTVPRRVELYTDPYVSDPDSYFLFGLIPKTQKKT
jgi:hypothetical protein